MHLVPLSYIKHFSDKKSVTIIFLNYAHHSSMNSHVVVAVGVPLGMDVGVFSPPLPVTGLVGVTAVLEGVVFTGMLLLRAEVLDDVIPVAPGFVGRTGLDFVI